MATKRGRMVTNFEGLLPINITLPFIHIVFQDEKQKPLYLHYDNTYGQKSW